MNHISKIGLVTLALAATLHGDRARADTQQPKHAVATTPDQVRLEVKQMFGFVPQLVEIVPDTLLVGFWASLKGLQMNPDTALDGKTKELIGLAVAAQIPCEFCVYFHTSAAKQHGASQAEIEEALGMSALTRMASTMLNGSQLDKTAFRKEADRMLKPEKKTPAQARSRPAPTR